MQLRRRSLPRGDTFYSSNTAGVAELRTQITSWVFLPCILFKGYDSAEFKVRVVSRWVVFGSQNAPITQFYCSVHPSKTLLSTHIPVEARDCAQRLGLEAKWVRAEVESVHQEWENGFWTSPEQFHILMVKSKPWEGPTYWEPMGCLRARGKSEPAF